MLDKKSLTFGVHFKNTASFGNKIFTLKFNRKYIQKNKNTL